MTTMTKMKMSSATLNLLKNYASINSNILVKPGNKITTISPVKNVMSEAIVTEDFDTEFGIWDLNKFLGVVSLFDKPEFAFDEKSVTISGTSGASVEYYYSEPSLLSVPTKEITMPEAVVSFKLTQKNFAELQKAASVLQVSDLAVRTDGDNLQLAVLDKSDVTSNCYTIDLGEIAGGHDFCFYFKVENLKMIEGDYNVDISDKNISQFSGSDVVYWIALETDSKYNG
tara:strand:+ start:6997 stop:7680 length:684 start_codon:yes stop_codon:yes gene_type:complete